MPSNKKPRKAYRPPAQRVRADHIKTFRFNDGADVWLQLAPHEALDSMRRGGATQDEFNTLALRITWGLHMTIDHFDNPEHREQLTDARRTLDAIGDEGTSFSASPEQLAQIGDALLIVDAMQKACTRRELETSLKAAIGAPRYAQITAHMEKGAAK